MTAAELKGPHTLLSVGPMVISVSWSTRDASLPCEGLRTLINGCNSPQVQAINGKKERAHKKHNARSTSEFGPMLHCVSLRLVLADAIAPPLDACIEVTSLHFVKKRSNNAPDCSIHSRMLALQLPMRPNSSLLLALGPAHANRPLYAQILWPTSRVMEHN